MEGTQTWPLRGLNHSFTDSNAIDVFCVSWAQIWPSRGVICSLTHSFVQQRFIESPEGVWHCSRYSGCRDPLKLPVNWKTSQVKEQTFNFRQWKEVGKE